jgi:hypothetical protein
MRQFLEPLARSHRWTLRNATAPALKTLIGVINRINASQFAIFILHFSFCNSLFSFQFLVFSPRVKSEE